MNARTAAGDALGQRPEIAVAESGDAQRASVDGGRLVVDRRAVPEPGHPLAGVCRSADQLG
jgi:hypothetical protein